MDKEAIWGAFLRNAAPGQPVELVVWDEVGLRVKQLTRVQLVRLIENAAQCLSSIERDIQDQVTRGEALMKTPYPPDFYSDPVKAEEITGLKPLVGGTRPSMNDEVQNAASNDAFDFRTGPADRRVSKDFSSDHPNRRNAVGQALVGFRWGRRSTDPIAY